MLVNLSIMFSLATYRSEAFISLSFLEILIFLCQNSFLKKIKKKTNRGLEITVCSASKIYQIIGFYINLYRICT